MVELSEEIRAKEKEIQNSVGPLLCRDCKNDCGACPDIP